MNREIIDRVTFLTEKIVNDEGLSVEENAELGTFLADHPKLVIEFEMRKDRTLLDIRVGLFLRGKTGWKSKMEADLRKGNWAIYVAMIVLWGIKAIVAYGCG
jgi:hypothetical protein